MRTWQIAAAAAWLIPATATLAQQPRPASTVQLPSFSFFSVSTAVSVPDSARGYGRVYAGGTKYAADGRSEFGPPFLPGNRAIGSERAARGTFVSAQIHDLHEMDSLLLSPEAREARAQRRATAAAAVATTERAQSAVERARTGQAELGRAPIRSVADIRRERESAAGAKEREALALVERGEQARADGKPGVARVFYQMAARRLTEAPQADGELKSRIQSLLEELDRAGQGTSHRP
jgi:hypothetical protein